MSQRYLCPNFSPSYWFICWIYWLLFLLIECFISSGSQINYVLFDLFIFVVFPGRIVYIVVLLVYWRRGYRWVLSDLVNFCKDLWFRHLLKNSRFGFSNFGVGDCVFLFICIFNFRMNILKIKAAHCFFSFITNELSHLSLGFPEGAFRFCRLVHWFSICVADCVSNFFVYIVLIHCL